MSILAEAIRTVGKETKGPVYRWNNGPLTTYSSYSRYVAVNSGTGYISLQVVEQDGLQRDITSPTFYVTGGLGGPIEQ